MNERISTHPCLRIGRYELFDELASGGMATVHIGRLKGAIGFSRMVAIKRMHPQFLKDRQFVTMFVDEARLAARIRHPNVVPIIDVVQTNEELFLVMDYVQGASLARAAALGRKNHVDIPIAVAASIAASVLHGLHAAHEAKDDRGEPLNIVHRDVSPQNVIIGVDGVARVLDFGIAKARGRLQDTAEGVVKGKLAYMAPEQVGGADLGREADLYAVGVILWEMLAGRRLHAATTQTQVLASVLRGVLEPPSKYRPEVPESLDRLVMKALSLDASARFSTAREQALALEDLMPVASAAHIARWLEQVADDVLQRSAIMVANVDSRPGSFVDIPLSIENMTTPASGSAARAEKTSASASPTEQAVVSAVPEIPARSERRIVRGPALLLGVVAFLAGAAIVAFLRFGNGERRDNTGTAVPLSTPSALPSTLAPALASTTPAPVETASASAAVPREIKPTADPIPVDRAPASKRVVVTPRSPPPPPVTAGEPPKPAAAPPKVDCDPPYTLDSRGIQRLKPQCL